MSTEERSKLKQLNRGLYTACGLLLLGLGAVGVFVPLLPTTPFLILAAFCFSRGSERLHTWLLGNRIFGETIRAWEERGCIGVRAKLIATTAMLVMVSYPLLSGSVPVVFMWAIVLTIAGVLVFIWSRPSK